jgi:hypothetical protein
LELLLLPLEKTDFSIFQEKLSLLKIVLFSIFRTTLLISIKIVSCPILEANIFNSYLNQRLKTSNLNSILKQSRNLNRFNYQFKAVNKKEVNRISNLSFLSFCSSKRKAFLKLNRKQFSLSKPLESSFKFNSLKLTKISLKLNNKFSSKSGLLIELLQKNLTFKKTF